MNDSTNKQASKGKEVSIWKELRSTIASTIFSSFGSFFLIIFWLLMVFLSNLFQGGNWPVEILALFSLYTLIHATRHLPTVFIPLIALSHFASLTIGFWGFSPLPRYGLAYLHFIVFGVFTVLTYLIPCTLDKLMYSFHQHLNQKLIKKRKEMFSIRSRTGITILVIWNALAPHFFFASLFTLGYFVLSLAFPYGVAGQLGSSLAEYPHFARLTMFFSVSGMHFCIALMTSSIGSAAEVLFKISEKKQSLFSKLLLSSHSEWWSLAQCKTIPKLFKRMIKSFLLSQKAGKSDKKQENMEMDEKTNGNGIENEITFELQENNNNNNLPAAYAGHISTKDEETNENDEDNSENLNLLKERTPISLYFERFDKIFQNSIYFNSRVLKWILISSIGFVITLLLYASFTETIFPSEQGPTVNAKGIIIDSHYQGEDVQDNAMVDVPITKDLYTLTKLRMKHYNRIIQATEQAAWQNPQIDSFTRTRFVVLAESVCEVFVPFNPEHPGEVIDEQTWTPEMKELFYAKKYLFNEMSRLSDKYGVYILFTYHEYHLNNFKFDPISNSWSSNQNTNYSSIAYNKLTVFSPFQPFNELAFTGKRDPLFLERMRNSKHLKNGFDIDQALARIGKTKSEDFEIKNQKKDMKLEFKLNATENGGGGIEIDYIKANLVFGSEAPKPFTAGEKILPFADTIFGRIGFIICMDATHPSFMRQAGLSKVDILLSPSWDWKGVTPQNTKQMSLRAIENGFVFFRVTQSGYSGLYDAYGNQLLGYNAFECPQEELEDCDSPCKHYPKCRRPHIISADIPTNGRKLTIYPYTYNFFEVFCGLCIVFEVLGVILVTIFLVAGKLQTAVRIITGGKSKQNLDNNKKEDTKHVALESTESGNQQ